MENASAHQNTTQLKPVAVLALPTVTTMPLKIDVSVTVDTLQVEEAVSPIRTALTTLTGTQQQADVSAMRPSSTL